MMVLSSSMASQSVYVDWKGNPIINRKGNGVKAATFTCLTAAMLSSVSLSISLNLVTYLQQTLHMGVARASTTITNFVGLSNGFSLIGAFISDSYITRFKTIIISGLVELLGLGLLTAQASLPSLHPPTCKINSMSRAGTCEEVSGYKTVFFFVSLYLYALGEGCTRASTPSLGGDQFDDDDNEGKRQKASYFNWYTFGFSSGIFIGATFIVWTQNVKGWVYGFGLCALIILLGIIILASGFCFIRNCVPQGSPLTRIFQVFVAAFKNRKLSISTSDGELFKSQTIQEDAHNEQLIHTKGCLRFLDKALIIDEEMPIDDNQRLQMLNKVEETKIIIRMIPIFLCSIISNMPLVLLLTLSVQQGTTMNTKVRNINVPPATLVVIPVTFQMVTLVIYDRWIVPFLQRITGYTNGITPLWRIGIGFFFIPVSTFIAALVEMRRMRILEEHVGSVDSNGVVPMSVMWLGFQFFVLGICDATSFVGLLDFFNTEISRGMKSIGSAIFFSIIGFSSFLGTIMIDIINTSTRKNNGMGWLEGNNLNAHTINLDKFYWLISIIGILSFLNYIFWANKYIYRHDQRLNSSNNSTN